LTWSDVITTELVDQLASEPHEGQPKG
jgi:hypothetical protein